MMKKIISTVLSVAMVLSSVQFAFAEEVTETVATEQTVVETIDETDVPEGVTPDEAEKEIEELQEDSESIMLMSVDATNEGGTAESSIEWTISEDGTLSVSGEGVVEEYPWLESEETITDLIVCEGITEIPDGAFSGIAFNTVTLPESLAKMGVAFDNAAATIFYVYEDSYAHTWAAENGYSVEFIETDTPAEKNLTIAEARTELNDAVVRISGTLTYIIDGLVYIQDNTGAIAVKPDILSDPQPGDIYTIKGIMCDVDGIRAIDPSEAECTSRGQSLPITKLTSVGDVNGGQHQGELIRLENVYLEKITEDGNLYIKDQNTGEHIYVYQPIELSGLITEDSYIDVTAIASLNNGTPVLRTITANDVVFTEIPIEIKDEAGLNAMRNNMQYNYKLMADITLSANWVCIGDNSKMYSGIFDGNGHTISNFNVVLDQEYQFMYAGLFGAIGGTGGVKNLTIEMTPDTGAVRAYNQVDDSYAGGITGYNNGIIENCHVIGTVDGKNYVGGIAGANSGTIKNCTFNGSLVSTGNYSGGIVGYNTGKLEKTMKATVFDSNVTSYFGGIVGYSKTVIDGFEAELDNVSTSSYAGGIVGASDSTIINCTSSGNISTGSYAGGIVGSGGTVSDCTSSMNVYGSDSVGGISGNNSKTITNCTYNGKGIRGSSNVGGIVGYNSGQMTECYVEHCGISASGSNAGGLAGYNSATIRNCHSSGTVGGAPSGNIGGLIGQNYCASIYDSYCDNHVAASGDYVGGIIGKQVGTGTISNCYSTGNIYAKGSYVGGVVGYLDNRGWSSSSNTAYPNITSCQYSGEIYATSYVGGIVGGMDEYNSSYPNHGVIIKNSFANATISGSSYLGGIVGNSYRLKMTESASCGSVSGTGDFIGGAIGYYRSTVDYPLNDNYSTSSATGRAYVGGFVGYVYTDSFVERNYSAGRVTASDPLTGGGFIGVNDGTNNILRNYFDLETSGQSDDTKGVPKTTAQMRNASNYVAWDFDTVWEIITGENNNYPQLRNTKDGGYTKAPVYYVSTEAELREFAEDAAGVCILENDIVLTENWNPIGTAKRPFVGVIYGNNHTISNLTIETDESYSGFVGYMRGGAVYDLNVKGNINSSESYIGGIVGYAHYPIAINNCYFEGRINGNSYIGGVVGYINNSVMNTCGADVIIASNGNYIGGLIGYNSGSTVNKSYAKGTVIMNNESSNAYYGGGLSGYSSSGYFSDCYSRMNYANTGTGSSYSGGFIGYISYSSSLYRCYHIGVTNSGVYYTTDRYSPDTSNCYTATSANDDSFKSQNKYSSSWDFANVWAIDPSINDGYPYLKDNYPVPNEKKQISIKTETDLFNIRNDLFGHYVLQNDIELTNTWNIIPEFYGVLDGNGYSVNNFNISGNNYVGLFGKLKLAEAKNININIGDDGIVGNNYVGAIAGQMWQSSIVGCNVYGKMKGNTYVGTITGYQYASSTIDSCKSDITLECVSSSGGLVGYSTNSTIYNSGVDAKITSTGNYIGGLIGYNSGSTVNKSYAKGTVIMNNESSNAYYGGGLSGYSSSGYFSDCYSRMNYANTGTGSSYSGGFIGYISYSSSLYRCYHIGVTNSGVYYTTDRYSPDTSNCYTATSANDDSFKSQNKYSSSWDFANVWAIDPSINDGYPYLRAVVPEADDDTSVPEEDDIIKIYTEDELKKLESSSEYFRLENDIELSGKWTPISVFNGTLDGNGYTISNLTVNGGTYSGLIARMYDGGIKNLTVKTSTDGVSGSSDVGILIGYATNAKFENCKVSGTVNASGSYSGLVAGYAVGCSFKDCEADGTVTGGAYTGGFAGYLADTSTVDGCGVNADVTASGNYSGGFVGYGASSVITNSYSSGSVDSLSYAVGGFIGYSQSMQIAGCYSHSSVYSSYTSTSSNNWGYGGFSGYTNYGRIENCYATGAVDGYFYVGGFTGCNYGGTIASCYSTGKPVCRYSTSYLGAFTRYSSVTITNCYYNKEMAENTYGSGTGLTTAEMQDMANFNEWNFDTVWTIDAEVNNGFPYLRFISPSPERVTMSAEKTTLYVGDTIQLSASIYPENAPGLMFWSSTDETVVTVTDTGYLTAVKEGVAEVSVRAGNAFAVKTFTILQRQSAGTISSVEEIAEVTLDYSSTYDEVLAVLPSTVVVNLANGAKATLPVEWSLVDGTKYTFTGNIVLDGESPITNPNGIKASCIVNILDAPSEIASVEEFDVSVPFATALEDVIKLLPQTATVTLENGKTYGLQILWSEDSEPYYRSTTEGTYKFNGELILPENGIILNSNSKKAIADVTVLEEPATERKITAIVAPEAIEVAYNTPLADVKALLPETVYAVFDNIESLPVSVVWSSNSSPSYESKVPGTYVFTGTITVDGNGLITNPYNLQATISVIVNESVSGGKNIYVTSETAAIGSTVDIDISFDPNSSMASGSFVVDYDPTLLSPVAYTVGEGIEMASVMVNMNYTDPEDGLKKIKVSFISFDELNTGGSAVKFTFKLNEKCTDGQVIPVTVKTAAIYDMMENPIAFTVYPGEVNAVSIMLGDTNGDGVVNILDAFRVVRFDVGFLQLTEKQKTAADVDRNDVVDIFDAMKIQRFDIGLADSFN